MVYRGAEPLHSQLIRTARQVNDAKPDWVLSQVKQQLADCLNSTSQRAADITIACFGLAFKADVDDLRESPALQVVRMISEWHQGPLLAVEPNITGLPASLSAVTLTDSDTALQQADILVMLVDHQPFKGIDKQQLAGRRIVDTRGLWT